MLDIILDEFHFASLWNGGIFLFLAFTAIIYLFLLPQEKNHPIWKSAIFLVGLVLLFLAIGSPLNIIGRIKFSTHIIQIVLVVLVVPPLLHFGLKRNVLNQVLKLAIVQKVVRFITKPIITIGLFYAFLYAYHHPPIFDQARTDLFWNYFYLLGLFIAAILLWAPIFHKELPSKYKMGYCFLNMVLLLPLGSIFLFSGESLYNSYTDLTAFTQALQLCLPPGETLSPEYILMLLPFQPVEEQQLGGWIWVISGLVIYSITALVVKKKANQYS